MPSSARSVLTQSRIRRIARGARDTGQRLMLSTSEPELARLLRLTEPYSLLAQRKRITLYRQAHQVVAGGASGSFVEIGVHRGGGSGMFAPVAGRAGRTLHLFDRWGDLPGPTAEDGEVGAAFDRDHVQRAREDLRASNPRAAAARLLVDELGLHPDRVVFHQGWFEKTFPAYDGGPIAFAHVDADWYESMSLAFDFLHQHLAEQATVVVDDLGDWPGVAIALAEFRESIGSVDLEVLNGQGVVKVRRDRVP